MRSGVSLPFLRLGVPLGIVRVLCSESDTFKVSFWMMKGLTMALFQRLGLGMSSTYQAIKMPFLYPRLFKYTVLIAVEFILMLAMLMPLAIAYAIPAIVPAWFSALSSHILLVGAVALGLIVSALFIALWLTMIELLREVNALRLGRERSANERWRFSWRFLARIVLLMILVSLPVNFSKFVPGVLGTVLLIIAHIWQVITMFALPIMIVQEDHVLGVIQRAVRFFYTNLVAVFGALVALLGYVLALTLIFVGCVGIAAYISKTVGLVVGGLLFVPYILCLMSLLIFPIVFYVNMQQKAD